MCTEKNGKLNHNMKNVPNDVSTETFNKLN